MAPKHITVFAGHYGSGKTQLAINYALWLKKQYPDVALADLDIVNPYYRTSDSAAVLEASGIRLIASPYAGTNVDLPSIPAEANVLFDNKDIYGVFDVGGDDHGALALGRYASALRDRDADVWLVVNCYRFHTKDEDGVFYMLREIERAAHIRFTGIVNNSNVGSLTTSKDLIQSEEDYARSVAEMCNLPLIMTTVLEDLYDEVSGLVTNPFPIRLHAKEAWKV